MTLSTLDRRSLLAAGLGLSAFGASAALAAGEPFFKRRNLQIGVQLYALGSDVLNDLDGALTKVKAAGYQAIEMPFEFVNHDAVKLKAQFDRAGLPCTSGQSELGPAVDVQLLADKLHTVGADTCVNQTIYPYLLGEPWTRQSDRSRLLHTTADGWRRSADFLNEKGRALKQRGIKLCYHNHNFEFAPVGDSYGWEILLQNTEPGSVYFQLDIGWCAVAGKDPVAMFAKDKGRYWSAHIKDIMASQAVSYTLHSTPNPARPGRNPIMDNAVVGQGKLEWAKILPAAYDAGVRRFFVEHEDPNRNPEAIAASCAYLTRLVA